jgi:hypothetical protein
VRTANPRRITKIFLKGDFLMSLGSAIDAAVFGFSVAGVLEGAGGGAGGGGRLEGGEFSCWRLREGVCSRVEDRGVIGFSVMLGTAGEGGFGGGVKAG